MYRVFCNLQQQIDHLFENFLVVLSALFWAFALQVAVYLLRTVESSGPLYAAGGNFVISFKKSKFQYRSTQI